MTDFDKKLYWERRQHGVKGQIGHVTAHQIIKDDEGNDQRIPIVYKPNAAGTMGRRQMRRSKQK